MAETVTPKAFPKPQKSNRLVMAIKTLQEGRGLKGKELAKLVGISPTSLSKIMQGRTQPRPPTLKQLQKHLCHTTDEVVFFQDAQQTPWDYDDGDDTPPSPEPESPQEKKLYLQARIDCAQRARLADLQNRIGKDLDKEGIPYKRHYVLGDIYIDYLIEFNMHFKHEASEPPLFVECDFYAPYQVALICHADLKTGLEKTNALANYLRKTHIFEEVIVTVPYVKHTPYRHKPDGSNPILNEDGVIARLKGFARRSAAPEDAD
jgi:transcriptional regulator with XRE-family HTH domain